MKCLLAILLLSILLKWSVEVELNMQGTVNLGQDVVEALSRFIEKKKGAREGTVNFRRSLRQHDDADTEVDKTIAKIVTSASLCRGLDICTGALETFLNKYITMLAEGIETVFKDLVEDINNKDDKTIYQVIIFEEELKEMMKDIKKLIRTANTGIGDGELAYTWTNLTKKISAKFLERAVSFGSQRLEGNAEEILAVTRDLTQKIVIYTSLIELKFENALCSQHEICAKSYKCTKSLNTIFGHLKTGSKDILKGFIKNFNEILPSTNFYTKLDDATANEFQTILRDMSETEALTKTIMSTVHKSLEERQKIIASKFKIGDDSLGRDVKLIHIILSDMDFFYSKQKNDPFYDFFRDFFGWLKEGGSLVLPLRRLMKDLQNKLSFTSNDLVTKLIYEVKVFMEITVDPAS